MRDLNRRTALKLLAAGASAAVGPAIELSHAAAGSPDAATPAAAPRAGERTLSERIADYLVSSRFEDLPAAAIDKAKEQLVFFFGRAFEVSFTEQGRQMRRVVAHGSPQGGSASVIGERLRLSPADAAFANATLYGASLSKDDVLADSDIHAGVVTLPVALAVGEARRASGRELILAIVLGYEVLGKLGRAALGWTAPLPRRSTNIFGGYGPSTVAGRLLRLDRERMAHAVGAGAHLCMGIAEGSMMEHYYSLIARNGTFAAQLVEAGASCYSRTTLEGELGLYRSFFGKVPDELPRLIDALGYQEILSTQQKRYPGTGHNTTATELFAEELAKSGLTTQRVARIEAVLPAKHSAAREGELAAHGPFDPPRRAYSSLPYALARVLLDGRVDPERFADERLVNDRDAASVMSKIDVRFEAGHGPRWARITIRTADGRKLERESARFELPFPRQAWGDWLAASGKRLLSPRQLDRLLQLLMHLEDVDDVSKLLAAATPTRTIARP